MKQLYIGLAALALSLTGISSSVANAQSAPPEAGHWHKGEPHHHHHLHHFHHRLHPIGGGLNAAGGAKTPAKK
jgi:hypothetical protein